MKKLKVKLQNCYGIRKLKSDFDFVFENDKAEEVKTNSFVIYAHNGTMKTSFAKVFKKFQLGEPKDLADIKDHVYGREPVIKDIKIDGELIKKEEIFVIEPYIKGFDSDKLSTLLATKELKQIYDRAYSELKNKKDEFIKILKNVSQSTDCEGEFIDTFSTLDEKNFFELLDKEESSLNGDRTKYDFKYNDVFDKDEKVKKFIEKHRLT